MSDHIVKILPHKHKLTEEPYPCFKCFAHEKSQLWEKFRFFPLRNFRHLYYSVSRNTILLQNLIIQFSLNYLSTGHSHEVKNKRFQIFGSKIGPGRLQEVVTRFQI